MSIFFNLYSWAMTAVVTVYRRILREPLSRVFFFFSFVHFTKTTFQSNLLKLLENFTRSRWKAIRNFKSNTMRIAVYIKNFLPRPTSLLIFSKSFLFFSVTTVFPLSWHAYSFFYLFTCFSAFDGIPPTTKCNTSEVVESLIVDEFSSRHLVQSLTFSL